MLAWKRLDIMDTPASPYAFKDNNPTLELGKSPLALCWKGEGITSPKAALLTDNYYEVLVSTENPVKVYALNTNDMTVRTEITYNGSGEFHPNAMLCPKGTQEGVWNNMQDVVYFVGGGRDYIMTSDRNFVAAEGSDVLPAGAVIADYTDAFFSDCDKLNIKRPDANCLLKKKNEIQEYPIQCHGGHTAARLMCPDSREC